MVCYKGKATPIRCRRLLCVCYRSQAWLPTVHEVLQADWHEVWHSPQPPSTRVLCRAVLLSVLMCFFILPPPCLALPAFYHKLPPSVKGIIFSASGQDYGHYRLN